MIEYKAGYRRIEDGWYLAWVIDFPGVATQGRTLNRARVMLADALQLAVESSIFDGQPIPRPDPLACDNDAERAEPMYVLVQTGSRVEQAIRP